MSFAHHNIKHLSASSLALYRNQPSLWVLQYLYGVKGEVGPAAWRGSAVESGVDWAVMRPGDDFSVALAKALDRFETDAQGESSNDVEMERNSIEPMLHQAVSIMKPLGMPIARQVKIEHWIDGIEVPVIGYIDYIYEDALVDLKTTNRMPSEPRPDHTVQVAIYKAAKQRAPKLAYVTSKKAEMKTLTDEQLEQGMWTAIKSAHAVRALLSAVGSREQAAALFVPDFTSYFWNDALITEALHIWRT